MSRSRVLENKNKIIDKAFSIVDAEGIEALSIRRLAKEVGVSSMTLYNYVRNIEDIRREVLVRSFNMLYSRIFSVMQGMGRSGYAGIAAFARAYALALYGFATEHGNICAYLICEGRVAFHDDAELRPFYNPFDGFLLSAGGERGEYLRRACRMYECALLTMMHEYTSGIKPLSEELLTACVDSYLSNMFPDGGRAV